MSGYEFWDELGKIFNAVVAYQEKNVEFNKRFISPWIRLGNVFEKQDRNKEAISAYEGAIAIDGGNPQNWFELGGVHFKMENYGEAVSAFNRALELDPTFGLAYSNLALTLVTTGETEQAIPLYLKGIELLQEPKDKAVAWNRLGNAYRKLNQYEQALEAFHRADELDRENAGFRDSLDEVTEGPTLVQAAPAGAEETALTVTVSPIELIVAENSAAEAAPQAAENASAELKTEEAPASEAAVEAPAAKQGATPAADEVAVEAPVAEQLSAEAPTADEAPEETTELETNEAPMATAGPVVEGSLEAMAALANQLPADPIEAETTEVVPTVQAEATAEGQTAQAAVAEAPALEAGAPVEVEANAQAAQVVEAAASTEETVTIVVQDSTQTFTETLPIGRTETETTDSTVAAQPTQEAPTEAAELTTEVVTAEAAEAPAVVEAAVEAPEATPEVAATELEETKPVAAVVPQAEAEPAAAVTAVEAPQDPAPNSLADQLLEAEPGVLDIVPQLAYEEYLKDTLDPMHVVDEDESGAEEKPGGSEPVATLDASGELQIEMDTKNAHVWNELGNVYFNTSAYDDAIVAYSKAIELDRWFAWPYSNLALAYVQKRRFVEAILLYQRSIELFSSDKDKAISWNRLGNVYRRLNDYENAIAAYQRADALDPDNSTLSLQSRFSLLGNYAMEQKPSYVS